MPRCERLADALRSGADHRAAGLSHNITHTIQDTYTSLPSRDRSSPILSLMANAKNPVDQCATCWNSATNVYGTTPINYLQYLLYTDIYY